MGKQSLRLRSLVGLMVVVVTFCFIGSYVHGESSGVEIMPLSSVKPGMRGVGRTVVKGTTIEEFDVEVLGVLPSTDGLKGLILVETFGPLIERAKGIASGMSGSPIYIDGKLVGGLGYKYGEAYGSLGLVTPIEDMLGILGYPNREDLFVPLNGGTGGFLDDAHSEDPLSEAFSEFEPIAVPVMVSGLGSERARRVMDAEMKRLNVGPVSTSGAGKMDMSVPIEPGSSLAVQLMRGDVNAYVLGTVTYVENNSILAFGHSVMHRGQTNYLASGAYIHAIAGGDGETFKIASPTDTIGTVTQDRMSGVAGVMGVAPKVVTVRLNVISSDIGRADEVFVELIRDDSLIPGLLLTTLLNGVDSTIDRIGAGTAYVSFEITADGLDSPLRRENVFFSGSDIAVVSLTEILECVRLLLDNDFQDVEILDIKVDVTVDSVRRTAVVEEVVLTNSVVEPGDVLEVRVLLRPYRGEPWVETVEIQIPVNMAPGYAVLTVHGGTDFALERAFDYETYEYYIDEMELSSAINADISGKNLDSAVQALLSRRMNNELVLSVISYASAYDIDALDDDDHMCAGLGNVLPAMEEENIQDLEGSELTDDSLEISVFTGYVLEGWKTVEFEIRSPAIQCEESEDAEDTEDTEAAEDVEMEEVASLQEEVEPLGLGSLGQVEPE